MNLYAEHADGFAEIVSVMGSDCPVFTWAQVDWQIIPGSVTFKKPLDIGGFSLNADLRFWVLLAQFDQSGSDLKDAMQDTVIAYLGDDYKVIGVSVAPGGLQAVIEANALNQGA